MVTSSFTSESDSMLTSASKNNLLKDFYELPIALSPRQLKRKFSDSDDARSYQEAQIRKTMELRAIATKKAIEKIKKPTAMFQNKDLMPRKERI